MNKISIKLPLYMLLIIGACNNNPSDAPNNSRGLGDPCDNINTCMTGMICDYGICRALCSTRHDCPHTQDCIDGRCISTNQCQPGWGTMPQCDKCLDKFYGPQCNPCPTCNNHGKCHDTLSGDGSCTCDDGWIGNNCEIEILCKNGDLEPTTGHCKEGSCITGFAGPDCDSCAEHFTDDCRDCVSGHFGPNCQPCQCVHGTCDEGIGGQGCICDRAWSGADCSVCDNPRAYGENCAICTRPNAVYDQATDTDCQLTDIRPAVTSESGTRYDASTEVYQLADIDGVLWMAENLRYYGPNSNNNARYIEHYSDMIPEIGNIPRNLLGYQYPYPVAEEICPAGWRLPGSYEISALLTKAGNDISGNILSKKMGGLDKFGLDFILTSYLSLSDDYLPTWLTEELAPLNRFWSSSSSEENTHLALDFSTKDATELISCSDGRYQNYFSVRCVKERCPGHFTADDQNNCTICQKGWVGDNCENPIVCQHGTYDKSGKCVGLCENGWIGDNCQYPITCRNGLVDSNSGKCQEGTCQNGKIGPNCDHCDDDHYGIRCQNEYGTITYKDITYKTVNINDQVWMAENLRHNQTTSFSLNKDPQNDAIYGRLYRRDAYLSSTICPSGWRLPTESDFQKLLNYIEQNRTCESAALSLIAHSDTWSDLKDVMGCNEFGFSAIPAGGENGNEAFVGYGDSAVFASSTDSSNSVAKHEIALKISARLYNGAYYYNTKIESSNDAGKSVRCIKN